MGTYIIYLVYIFTRNAKALVLLNSESVINYVWWIVKASLNIYQRLITTHLETYTSRFAPLSIVIRK